MADPATQAKESDPAVPALQTPGARNPAVESIIARRLADQPAYLLIFGLVFIGMTAGSALALTGQSIVAITLAFSVVGGLIASVVIFLNSNRSDDQLRLTGSADVDDHLKSVASSLRDASKIKHPGFRQIVVQSCAQLDEMLANIRNGQVQVKGRDYNLQIHNLFKSAKSAVYCVHRGDYLSRWFELLGLNVIKSHAASGVIATHIFAFDKRSEVDTGMLELLRTLNKSQKVTVLVYFDDENTTYKFPENFPGDYVVLDGGDAICVTTGKEKHGFSGTWYFNDQARRALYNNEFSDLRDASKGLDEVFPELTPSGTAT